MLSQQDRESYAFGIYEMSKDLGSRKSVDLDTISDADLIADYEFYSRSIVDSIAQDKADGQQAIIRFEAKLAQRDGNTTKASALRALLSTDVMFADLGYFCFEFGLPYEYEAEIERILNSAE